MNTEIPQALYGNAVEHLVITYVKTLKAEDLLSLMESEAVQLLTQIKAILDDNTLDDAQCFRRMEKIVDTLGEKGIYTSRHDW